MPHGILVLENGEWMSLPEVLGNEEFMVWRCRVCKAWNTSEMYYCHRCGSPIGSKPK